MAAEAQRCLAPQIGKLWQKHNKSAAIEWTAASDWEEDLEDDRGGALSAPD
jgi:hypothetical protein